jgi:hypothetical protein
MTPETNTNDSASSTSGGAMGDDKSSNQGDNKGQRYRRQRFRKPPAAAATRTVVKQPKFEGKCDKLKGHIYDCTDVRQSDMFVKTTKEISKHAGSTFTFGGDARRALENLTLPTLQLPQTPTSDDITLVRIWQKEVDEYVRRKGILSDNMQTVYSLVWGQCTDVMRQKIEALTIYEQLTADGDGLELLKAIKDLVYNFQSRKYLSQALHSSKQRFYYCKQGRTTPLSSYMEQFQNMIDVIHHSGGSLGDDPGVLRKLASDRNLVIATLNQVDGQKLRKDAKDQNLAASFIMNADRSRYGPLITDLENNFLQGTDRWPKTLPDAHSLLSDWSQGQQAQHLGPPNDGVSFLNEHGDESNIALATDGEQKDTYKGKNYDKAKVTCHRCGKKGHYAPECNLTHQQAQDAANNKKQGDQLLTAGTETSSTSQHQTGEQLLMAGLRSGEFDESSRVSYQFHQHTTLKMGENPRIPPAWILLDNQSTVDVFHNADLLDNIRHADGFMDIHCNAGMTSTNLVGDLLGYGEVWYNPNGIANILSLS